MNTSSPPLAPFRYRDYTLLWFGNFASLTGTEMTRTAVAWQIYDITGDPLALGAIGLARLIPIVLLALGAGVLADALDRRKLMLGAQFAMLLCSVGLAVTSNANLSALWLIYVLTGLASAASTLGLPARQAIVPALVPREHLASALSLNITAWQLATVIGPTIAGILIAQVGVSTVYWIDVASFTVIIGALLLMSYKQPLQAEKRDISLGAALEGLRFVLHNKLIWSTMLLDFLATFFSSATTMLPLFAEEVLAVGPQGMGLLFAAPSAGAVVASIITSIWGAGRKQGPLLLWAVVAYGACTAIFGLSTSFWISLFALAGTGAADTLSMVVRGTIRNLETPDELRGRMVAVNMIFFAGGPQLGEIEAGIAARFLGGPLSVFFGGIACIAATAWVAAATPELRAYSDFKYRNERAESTTAASS
jgi:MFS family permease